MAILRLSYLVYSQTEIHIDLDYVYLEISCRNYGLDVFTKHSVGKIKALIGQYQSGFPVFQKPFFN